MDFKVSFSRASGKEENHPEALQALLCRDPLAHFLGLQCEERRQNRGARCGHQCWRRRHEHKGHRHRGIECENSLGY